ncbi:MAG: DUF2232 domain-containing protein [Erysipelotrichaceae bacterium]|nr:DUF2232 domain-containing protein [Erysipelotrichaceae bacterium]
MQKRRLTSLTYGALICAMAGALLTVNRYVLMGGLDLYLYWIIPLPVIVYTVKFTTRDAIVMGIAMILLSFVLATPATVFYVAGSVIAGIVYGDGMNRGRSATYLIVSLILVSIVMIFITSFVFAAAFGYDLLADIEFYRSIFSQYMNISGEAFSRTFILNIIVISTILSSVMEGFLVHILAFAVLRKLKMQIPPMKPLGMIYAPTWLKVFILAAVALYAVTRFARITQYDDYITPVLALALFGCSAFGYIAVTVYISLFSGGKKNRLVPILLAVSYFLLFYVYVIIGIFDIFSDRRKNLIEELKQRYENQKNDN